MKFIFIAFTTISTVISCSNARSKQADSIKANISVSSDYNGPVVIFWYESDKFNQDSVIIKIDTFGIESATVPFNKELDINVVNENGKNLRIVPIGKENELQPLEVGVFQLGNENYATPNCNNDEMIYTLTFYKGTKESFLEYRKKYHSDAFEYFSSHNIDWCKIFLEGKIHN